MARRTACTACWTSWSVAWSILVCGVAVGQDVRRPEPTHRDVKYGPHERNVLDFWQAESERAAPLVVYIHGGGFRNGSKDGINAVMLRQLLDARISVAALNYRFVQQAPLPAAHHDCRRALQLLRSKAQEWNIDKSRIGAFGGSAGAQLCMYLAFHDDMARPDSADPLERESTRLACVATGGGQTTMDVDWWTKHIPGYDAPHRDFRETFGVDNQQDYERQVADVSALSLISADDPPIFMSYGMAPDALIPDSAQRAQGWKVHHVAFGVALKKKMDELSIEAVLKHPGAETPYQSNVEFLAAKLGRAGAQQRGRGDAQQRGRRPAGNIINRIKSNDKDGDGKITQEEASPVLKRLFGRFDSNDDGVIDEAELKQLEQRRPGRRRPNAARRGGDKRPTAEVPDGVKLEVNIAYREGNEKWRLDLARPAERGESSRPAIVFVHGGGWRSGDKGGGVWRGFPLQYAAKGYVCVSVNYRLTDEAPFPACVEDVKCAVRWLRAHADKYHVDPHRVGAYGNSAGAHLVAMLGLVGADAKLEGDGPHQEHSSQVQAVCCSATPTDFSQWGDGPFRGGRLLAGPPDSLDQRRRQASPISYVGSEAPPFLIVHGTADRTVPFGQGERFAEALKNAGAKDVTFLKFEGSGHGVFNQHAEKTYAAMEKFFARTLWLQN